MQASSNTSGISQEEHADNMMITAHNKRKNVPDRKNDPQYDKEQAR